VARQAKDLSAQARAPSSSKVLGNSSEVEAASVVGNTLQVTLVQHFRAAATLQHVGH